MSEEYVERCFEMAGLRPLDYPLGDDHHTDVPMTDADKTLGDALAGVLGTMYNDVIGPDCGYFYTELSAVEEWSRVARALRIHGLKIVNA